jgi:hypothetical protein
VRAHKLLQHHLATLAHNAHMAVSLVYVNAEQPLLEAAGIEPAALTRLSPFFRWEASQQSEGMKGRG